MNMEKTSLEYKKGASSSFSSWSADHASFVESELLTAGIDFLLENGQNLKTSLTHLLLDDKWHYLDRAKKESYRARIEINNNGTPWLHLVYHTFTISPSVDIVPQNIQFVFFGKKDVFEQCFKAFEATMNIGNRKSSHNLLFVVQIIL